MSVDSVSVVLLEYSGLQSPSLMHPPCFCDLDFFCFFVVCEMPAQQPPLCVYVCATRHYASLSDHPSCSMTHVGLGDAHVTGIPLMNALFCRLSHGVPHIEVVAYAQPDATVSHTLVYRDGTYGVLDTHDVDAGGGTFWYNLYHTVFPQGINVGSVLGTAIQVFMDRVAVAGRDAFCS